MTIEDQIAEVVRRVVREELTASPTPGAPLETARDCMTLEQLAGYWDVSPSSIAKWQRRAPQDSPLPHGYVGDSPRFYRTEIEEWSRQERERREAKKMQKKNKTGQQQPGKQPDSGFEGSEGKMPSTLTTAKAPKGGSGHGGIQTIQGKTHPAGRSKLAHC